MTRRLPLLIRIWFALALALALFPPLHWAASGAEPVFGIPKSLFYIFAASAFAAAGVVAAYLADRGGEG